MIVAKNTPLIKDWLAFGFATGALLSTAKTVVSSLMGRAGVRSLPFGRTATHLILGNRTRPWWSPARRDTREEKALGAIVDTMMGGLYGTATSFVIALSPPGNEVAKGSMAGALASIATIAFGRVLRIQDVMAIEADEAIEMIAAGALFGGVQGLILGRYGSGMTIQSHPILVKQVNTRQYQQGRLDVDPPTPSH